MSNDGAVVRAQLFQAAEVADRTASHIQGAESNSLDGLAAALMVATAAAEATQRLVMPAVTGIQESRSLASTVVVGTSDTRVQEGIQMLNEAETDQEDMGQKLRFVKEELEKLKTIIQVAINDKNADVPKVHSAASHFRRYANDVP